MKYILIFWLTIAYNLQMALGAPVNGLILDADTKEPLPFTNIIVEGYAWGTVANSEGEFVLDLEGVTAKDTVLFSFIGYETLRVCALVLKNQQTVYLHPAAIQLSEVQVLSKTFSASEIVQLVEKQYKQNHPATTGRQRIFFHQYEKIPFPKENKLIVKRSDFVGLDKKTFAELFAKLPPEFVEYQDAIADLYTFASDNKLIPVKAISLEEGSKQELFKEVEDKLKVLFEDLEKTAANPDIYYKFRTGILGHKIAKGGENAAAWEAHKNDSLHHTVKTGSVKNEMLSLLHDYSELESKNWEFITDREKYTYTTDDMTSLNGELVYKISFQPGKHGMFEGVMYISAHSYAVLQLDFAYAKGKQSERFHLFGFGHSMNFKEGRVIFEKGKNGYQLKYVYARQNESASINRNFSVMKKQKRFLIDKELNEIKIESHLSLKIENYRELLVLDREEIDENGFQKIQEPDLLKFRKEFAYSPEMWQNESVLAPTSEMKKYKRK